MGQPSIDVVRQLRASGSSLEDVSAGTKCVELSSQLEDENKRR